MGGGGGWEAEGGLKHPFGLKEQCCTFSMGHKLIQSTRETKTALRSSFVPHAILLKPSRAMKCTSWLDSIGEKPSVKADLVIYDQVLGVSG